MTRTAKAPWAPPKTMKLSKEAARACVFKPGLTRPQARQMAHAGVFGVVPLGSRREELFGIRIVPGRALAESPIVRVMGAEVETIASRPACFVPWLAYPGTCFGRDGWDISVANLAPVWDELAKVDATLGGTGVDTIRALLADNAIADAHSIGDLDAMQAGIAKARKAIDPSPETARYFDYMLRIVDTDAFEPPPDALGCWTTAAWGAAFAMADGGDDAPEAREWAWRAWCAPHGLDCFQSAILRIVAPPCRSPALLVKAAKRLATGAATAEQRDDPRWAPAEALAADPEGYAGLAHIDAAAALKKAGREEEAFDALTSAAYWLAIRVGESGQRVQLAEAAQLLAQESGWDGTYTALVLAAKRLNAA